MHLVRLIPIALIVIVDELNKHFALKILPNEGSIVGSPIISLAIHKNWGVAFDIPFRLEFIILIALAIGLALGHIAYKNRASHPKIAYAAGMIILGGLGNLYDRLVYGFTVDYIIFFGRSAINLSDVIIVMGVVLLLLSSRRRSS